MKKFILAAVVMSAGFFAGGPGAIVCGSAAHGLAPAHLVSASAAADDAGSSPDGFTWP